MKIERIAPNKIKITLSVEDLKKWDVNFESLTYNSPEAQELFWTYVMPKWKWAYEGSFVSNACKKRRVRHDNY